MSTLGSRQTSLSPFYQTSTNYETDPSSDIIRRQRRLKKKSLQILRVFHIHIHLQTHLLNLCQIWRFSPTTKNFSQCEYYVLYIFLEFQLCVNIFEALSFPTRGHLNFLRMARSYSRLSRPKLRSNAPLKQTFYLRILFFVINKCCRIKQSHLLVFGTAVD